MRSRRESRSLFASLCLFYQVSFTGFFPYIIVSFRILRPRLTSLSGEQRRVDAIKKAQEESEDSKRAVREGAPLNKQRVLLAEAAKRQVCG